MAGVKDPADHAGHGRLPAGAAHGDAALGSVEKLRKELRAREMREAQLSRAKDVGDCVLDCRRRDQRHPWLKSRAVLRKQLDPERAEIVELVRRAAGVERSVR